MRQWYLKNCNCEEGINEYLDAYNDFYEIVCYRKKLAEQHPEFLQDFYIFKDGLFLLAKNGELKKCLSGFRTQDFQDGKRATPHTDFWNYRKVIGRQHHPLLFSRPITLAKPDTTCPECGYGWDFSNCEDVVSSTITRPVHLHAFEGNALQRVIDFFTSIKNGDYRVFEETLLKRNGVWLGEQDGITPYTIIEKRDELLTRIIHYRHILCDETFREKL